MRLAWLVIRAIATAVAVCVLTALISSAVLTSIYRRNQTSQLGRIGRGIEVITPEVQRRDKEVEDLTRP
jgi:hypothetical protein